MSVSRFVKDLVKKTVGESKMKVGKIVRHPDGRTVKIVGGKYWGTYGLSNHWTWREVRSDGSLGPQEDGYGW